MATARGLDQLHLLVQVCLQLPEDEADRLQMLAIDDPGHFAAAVLGHLAQGTLALPAGQVRMLEQDAGAVLLSA